MLRSFDVFATEMRLLGIIQLAEEESRGTRLYLARWATICKWRAAHGSRY